MHCTTMCMRSVKCKWNICCLAKMHAHERQDSSLLNSLHVEAKSECAQCTQCHSHEWWLICSMFWGVLHIIILQKQQIKVYLPDNNLYIGAETKSTTKTWYLKIVIINWSLILIIKSREKYLPLSIDFGIFHQSDL